MNLPIGVLTVKGAPYHPTRRLAQAAQERNAEIIAINPYRVAPAYLRNQPILHGDPAASAVRVVLPRQGAGIKTACLPLIAHFEQMGARVINGSHAIRMARNKFFMLQALTRKGLAVPDTIFAAATEACRQAREDIAPHPAVLKPINGRQGTGLHCLMPESPLPAEIAAQLAAGQGALVQTFIAPDRRKDLRVLVIGQSVAGAIELTPPQGDFRANVHLGGRPAAVELSAELADLAVRAARALEMEIAGIDLMLPFDGRPMIVEVNSAPGFRALEAVTGKDIAGAMIDYAKSVCDP